MRLVDQEIHPNLDLLFELVSILVRLCTRLVNLGNLAHPYLHLGLGHLLSLALRLSLPVLDSLAHLFDLGGLIDLLGLDVPIYFQIFS